MLTARQRREAFDLTGAVASCANRAAGSSGKGRAMQELRDGIAEDERGHLRFKPEHIPTRVGLSQATDLFVCRVLASGRFELTSERPIAVLDGVRVDYVRGAILYSNARFRSEFEAYLRERFPGEEPDDVLKRAGDVDYAELQKGGDQ